MAGVYIHIPFCRYKCNYCNFYSVASDKLKENFIEALVWEINKRYEYLDKEEVNTIYFGGGTPSILSLEEVETILEAIYTRFNVCDFPEITFECNPDDVSLVFLQKIMRMGVNRISIGTQSFFDNELKYLSRTHNSQVSLDSIEIAKKAGFTNISVDLIYGVPGSDLKSWRKNLETVFSFNIPHISGYALTIEDKTTLNWLITKRKIPSTDENITIEQFKVLKQMTADAGYKHYEISNFAFEGFYSKHNSLYWLGGKYIGLGPSAHSYNGRSRQWNISNISDYKSAGKIEMVVDEKEVLTSEQMYNEYIMTSLRTEWGVDTEHIENVFGEEYSGIFLSQVKDFVAKNIILQSDSKFVLNDTHKFLADGIISELFISR